MCAQRPLLQHVSVSLLPEHFVVLVNMAGLQLVEFVLPNVLKESVLYMQVIIPVTDVKLDIINLLMDAVLLYAIIHKETVLQLMLMVGALHAKVDLC